MTDQQGSAAPRLWQRVADRIAEEVADLEPGTRLPSEAEQRARFDVSRVTLRQALSHVQAQGLLESRPGQGWFRVDESAPRDEDDGSPVFEPPGKIMSFSDMARSRGLVPDSIVLERAVHPATFSESEAFAIAPGADVLLLRRLRRLDGMSVAVDTSLVPLSILPTALTIDFSAVSLHDCFRAAGHAPAIADTEVEAIVAGEAQARLLDVPEGFPLLNVQQAFYDSRNRAIERAVITYRGDRYRFRARLNT
jgi:DNA-binding GntR family transcriptional regulator